MSLERERLGKGKTGGIKEYGVGSKGGHCVISMIGIPCK